MVCEMEGKCQHRTQSARFYIHQLCSNTGCSLEYLPIVMDNKNILVRGSKRIPCYQRDFVKDSDI